MDLPVLDGIIDRRILVNYRVRPDIVKALLPAHLEPLVINGYASAGICLLRLKNIGIKYSPSVFRITSENAAHRILVKYFDAGKAVEGVYIPRRDTDSMLNVLLAGRIFSWPHFQAKFVVEETSGRFEVSMESEDLNTRLHVKSELTDDFPADSMFDSLQHASTCFQHCSVGVSPATVPGRFKTIQLKTKTWAVQPLHVHELQSSFYDNTALFPQGTIRFDNAMLMQGIAHEWCRPV